MIRFQAHYFDGVTSQVYPVTVVYDRFQSLTIEGEDWRKQYYLKDCKISPPLGTTRRVIRLPQGDKCETEDLDAFASLESYSQQNRGQRFVHFLESRWRWVLASSLTLVLVLWLFLNYGVPFLAEKIAYSLPPSVHQTITDKSLVFLDRNFFAPSKLSSERIATLQKNFQTLTAELGSNDTYQLEFRSGQKIGSNAMALPSGLIIFTDELVALAKNDRQILAVLTHEVAHIQKQHGIRSLIQDAGVFFILAVLLGDFTSITSLSGVLPTLLIESSYSRKFEKEADTFAALYFIGKGWGTKPLQEILQSMSNEKNDSPGVSLFSTHPNTQERIEYLQSLEDQFTQ